MIDLHMHTTYSDGQKTVKELLLEAEQKGLKTISITDHDTCKAYDELKKEEIRSLFSGNIIQGIEINTGFKGYKIELLGYNFDNYEYVQEYIEKANSKTDEEWNQIMIKERKELIDKFKKLDLKFDIFFEENLLYKNYESNIYNSVLEKNDINYIKEKMGSYFFESGYEFYRKCVTSPESPFFINYSKYRPTIEEITKLIHDNGGIVFLAHPLLYGMKNPEEKLNELYLQHPEIDGIECYYNGFDEEQINFINNFAKERNLLISGGSDYHAIEGFKNQLGCCMHGNSYIDDSIIENWNIKSKNI